MIGVGELVLTTAYRYYHLKQQELLEEESNE